MTKRVMRVPTPSPPLVTPVKGSEKAKALADNMETQFQPETVPSAPAVTEIVDA